MVRVILKENSYTSMESTHYLQTQGKAMGKKTAVLFANI